MVEVGMIRRGFAIIDIGGGADGGGEGEERLWWWCL